MENREILVANTRTQQRSKITTAATTLGELKAAFREAGINYTGMDFTEGISKTHLLGDDTQLPQSVMYKGQPTSNLVIILTNTKKNISSGAGSRAEAYAAVKASNLQDEVKKHFGRNFTQVPTDALWSFLESHSAKPAAEEPKTEEPKEEPVKEEAATETNKEQPNPHAVGEALFYLIGTLVSTGAITLQTVELLNDALGKLGDSMKQGYTVETHVATEPEKKEEKDGVSTEDGSITDDDITDMINDLA